MGKVPKHYRGSRRTLALQVTFTDEENDKLLELARLLDTSKAGVIRKLILDRYAELAA